jgi:hypothetical protein
MGANMNLSRVLPFSAASLLLLAIGCGSSTSTAPPATTIYVVGNGGIQELPANGQGNVTPTATLTPPAGTTITSLAVDQSGNLYVGAEFDIDTPPTITANYEVLVYAAGATGAATPLRTLTIQPNNLSYLYSIAVDATGQIYTVGLDNGATNGFNAINVYAPNASGAATPIRQISGAHTYINNSFLDYSIFLDGAGNIYYDNDSQWSAISVFPTTATGDVAPARVVIEEYSNLTNYSFPVAVDAAGDIFELANDGWGNYEVLEYAPSTSDQGGSVGPASNTFSFTCINSMTEGMAVDAAGNLYIMMNVVVLEAGVPSIQPTVYVFSPGATGNAVPARTMILSGAYDYLSAVH